MRYLHLIQINVIFALVAGNCLNFVLKVMDSKVNCHCSWDLETHSTSVKSSALCLGVIKESISSPMKKV